MISMSCIGLSRQPANGKTKLGCGVAVCVLVQSDPGGIGTWHQWQGRSRGHGVVKGQARGSSGHRTASTFESRFLKSKPLTIEPEMADNAARERFLEPRGVLRVSLV